MKNLQPRRLPRNPPAVRWRLRLFVADQSAKSITAVANLKRICAEHLHGACSLEVIDLLQHPNLARRDQIIAIPTLLRVGPGPVRRVLGDLSNTERVLKCLSIAVE